MPVRVGRDGIAVIGEANARRSESPFTLPEGDLIRLELMPRFGQDPDLANAHSCMAAIPARLKVL
jgi:hypothetical protein